MNIIIAGSRDFKDSKLLKHEVDRFIKSLHINDGITIVSGAAKGADRLGELYAEESGYNVIRHPAQWDVFGRSAGYRRNLEMAGIGDALIAFWDGESKGTRHMIDIAVDHELLVKVVFFNV